MKELGFFIDNLGNILYYGEYKEQYDKHNRHEVHDTSFEDEVENTQLFRNLNLQYNKDMGLYGKAIVFALQGMILMQNLTSENESKFIMHVPIVLSENQKKSLAEQYPLLSVFEKAKIVIPKSLQITQEDTITDLNDYYEAYDILKAQKTIK